MADKPFMLVSLEEAKAKKLAQVLNNETCTKILNYLAKGKDGTETEIAKKLKLPLSTVHYNLKQLVQAKLVIADEYHYSEKGREVNHYRLANKYIIIAPEEEQKGFMEKLKHFIPVTLVVAGAAIVLKIMNVLTGVGMQAGDSFAMPQAMKMDAAPEAAPTAVRSMIETAEEDAGAFLAGAADNAMNATNLTIPPQPPIPNISPEPGIFLSNNVILAFVIGGVFAIAALILLAYIKHLKQR